MNVSDQETVSSPKGPTLHMRHQPTRRPTVVSSPFVDRLPTLAQFIDPNPFLKLPGKQDDSQSYNSSARKLEEGARSNSGFFGDNELGSGLLKAFSSNKLPILRSNSV
jgi:hypothetical protein